MLRGKAPLKEARAVPLGTRLRGWQPLNVEDTPASNVEALDK